MRGSKGDSFTLTAAKRENRLRFSCVDIWWEDVYDHQPCSDAFSGGKSSKTRETTLKVKTIYAGSANLLITHKTEEKTKQSRKAEYEFFAAHEQWGGGEPRPLRASSTTCVMVVDLLLVNSNRY